MKTLFWWLFFAVIFSCLVAWGGKRFLRQVRDARSLRQENVELRQDIRQYDVRINILLDSIDLAMGQRDAALRSDSISSALYVREKSRFNELNKRHEKELSDLLDVPGDTVYSNLRKYIEAVRSGSR